MRNSPDVGTDDDSESADPFLAEIARIESEGHPEVRLPGARVGRFTIRAELGRGGMGVVYRADDEQLGRSVALKMLRPGRDTGAARRARFLREARSAAALVHPNLAALYEIGEDTGQLFIAMELVEGEDLRRVLSRGPLPVAEAVRIGLGVARGVAAAHQRGIVHRDLKPENVMLDTDGEPKVLDFGLAKLTESDPAEESLTEEGLRMGTPGYMSPEQASGEALDARTDVFSFGVMLFELLAGRRPRNEASSKLRDVRPEVPPDLAELVESCLEKLPARRPETMRGVVDRLTRATTADPVPAAKAKRRSLRGVWFALVVVGAGVVATLVFRDRRSHAAPPVAVNSDAAAMPPVPTVRMLTDYAAPATNNPAAAAAFASAMQNLRDASIALAATDFARAATLDPSFAAAHLRLVSPWWRQDSLGASREHYAAASQFRQTLDGRERLLLVAGEAVMRSPVDWAEVATRVRAVLTRYPDDPEALLWLADALMNGGEREAARTVAEQALVSDPELAMAHWMLSQTYLYASADGQEVEIDKCLALSPNAASCLRCREILYDQEGRCADFEDTARKIVAIEPKGPLAYVWLADALAARAAPLESVRAVLDKAIAVDVEEAPADAPGDRAVANVGLALLVGDFPAAMAAARERDRATAGDTSEGGHVGAAMTVISSLEEEGRTSDALAAAEDFERRAPAWVPNDVTVRHYLLYARRHAGKLGDAEFARDFAHLETESLVGHSERMTPEIELMLRTEYLQPADVPSALPHLDRRSLTANGEGRRGRALLLAGRAADAVAPLRVAAAACDILPTENELDDWFGHQAFAFMRARLWLGEALEATGDTHGACAAYGVVLHRWKNAKPRSVTLEAARTHARALHCP